MFVPMSCLVFGAVACLVVGFFCGAMMILLSLPPPDGQERNL